MYYYVLLLFIVFKWFTNGNFSRMLEPFKYQLEQLHSFILQWYLVYCCCDTIPNQLTLALQHCYMISWFYDATVIDTTLYDTFWPKFFYRLPCYQFTLKINIIWYLLFYNVRFLTLYDTCCHITFIFQRYMIQR